MLLMHNMQVFESLKKKGTYSLDVCYDFFIFQMLASITHHLLV